MLASSSAPEGRGLVLVLSSKVMPGNPGVSAVPVPPPEYIQPEKFWLLTAIVKRPLVPSLLQLVPQRVPSERTRHRLELG